MLRIGIAPTSIFENPHSLNNDPRNPGRCGLGTLESDAEKILLVSESSAVFNTTPRQSVSTITARPPGLRIRLISDSTLFTSSTYSKT